MTPDELRKLADEATTKPMRYAYVIEVEKGSKMSPDVQATLAYEAARIRLKNIAPDLARLCADLEEALDVLWNEAVGDAGGADEQVKAALAKLSELNNGADEPPARERT